MIYLMHNKTKIVNKKKYYKHFISVKGERKILI